MLAAVALGLFNCSKSDSSGGTSGRAKQASGMERAAQDAALAEVKKHWSKAADGWITARNSGTSFAPVRFIRSRREVYFYRLAGEIFGASIGFACLRERHRNLLRVTL